MNKQELIKHFEEMEYVSIVQMGKKSFIDMIEQLNEPQKVTIPQFVADWIKYCKNTGVTLVRALLVEEIDLYNYANQKDYKKLKEFLKVKENQEIFARAWLDGYEIEKEKRYIVKVKGVEESHKYLNHRISLDSWFFSGESEPLDFRVKHTQKDLEKAGFGWIFDCKGIEVKEVKE
jgi:hypothetical protein|nr:MAG TPA: Protein of unknown function (DUF1642) [Caudoviricetes sp.]